MLAFLIVSPSCGAQIKKARDTYPNGQAKYKGKYIQCTTREDKYPYALNYERRKFGEWVYYYPSGVIAAVRHYTAKVKNCKQQILKEGEWKYFNEDGILYRREVYTHDTLVVSEIDIYEQQLPVGKITLRGHAKDTAIFVKKEDINNLILNASFEQYFYKSIPVINNGKNQIEQLIPYWHSPDRNTPDYYNPYRKVAGIPEHFTTVPETLHDNGYVGLMLYRGEQRQTAIPLVDDNEGVHRYFFDYKERIQAKLVQKLVKNKTYCFKARISLSRNSGYAIDRFEVLFSDYPVQFDYHESFKDSILSFRNIPGIAQQWFPLCKGFTASGNEMFITLGRFSNHDKLSVTPRMPEEQSELEINRSAYYLIDDLRLFPVDSLSECACASLETEPAGMNDQHAFEKITLDEITAGKRFTLGTVRFDFDKALIRDSSLTELKRLRDYLILDPAVSIVIFGHTDDAGTPLHNQRLSEARARAVKDWLVANGVEERRVSYEGLGDRFPLAENTSKGNRKINRRVEFEIVRE